MAKNRNIKESTIEAEIRGLKTHKRLERLSKTDKVVIIIALFLLLGFLSVAVYSFFRESSSLTTINEDEYLSILRRIDGRSWYCEAYELRELRELVFEDATRRVITERRDSSLIVIVEGSVFSVALEFAYKDGAALGVSRPELRFHYTQSKEGTGEAILIQKGGRTIVLYPERL